MTIAVRWGLILGVVVGVLGFVFAGLGLHVNPSMAAVFVGLAIVINVVVILLALRQAAPRTSWGGQVRNGVVIGVLGAIVIFVSSWTMTTVVFPEYYREMFEGYRSSFVDAGLPPDEIDQQMQVLEATTPVSSALQGAIGTVITSLTVAAIGGFFWRRKP